MQKCTRHRSHLPRPDHLQTLGHRSVSSRVDASSKLLLTRNVAGQMANGKDFFQELRKQVSEKLQEREQGEKPKQSMAKEGGTPTKGG